MLDRRDEYGTQCHLPKRNRLWKFFVKDCESSPILYGSVSFSAMQHFLSRNFAP